RRTTTRCGAACSKPSPNGIATWRSSRSMVSILPKPRSTVSYLDGLNPEQRAAVVHGEGPLLVLAGAGSGKTRVLVSRVAHLVEKGAVARRILAVTFTNKAAGEMRERLAQLLGERTSGMWIGTFHATCARLLRTHAERVGLTRDFTIF